MLGNQQLRAAVYGAGLDWLRWRRDYEFEGEARSLPVLQDEQRFLRFLKDYTPFKRHTSRSSHLELRDYLLATNAIDLIAADKTGQKLQQEAEYLASHFPNLGRPVSALSKIAMFADPESFPPSDTFARIGASLIGAKVEDYPRYLEIVLDLWRGEIGKEIREILISAEDFIPTQHPGFGMRVLDHALMTIGGRSPSDLEN